MDYKLNPKTFWVIFSTSKHWMKRILKKNFSHVYILYKDDFNWVVIEALPRGLSIEILNARAADDVITFHMANNPEFRSLKIETTQSMKLFNFNIFRCLSCVSMVKYILGIKLFCYTPFGLYKKLLKLEPTQYKACGIKSIEQIGD